MKTSKKPIMCGWILFMLTGLSFNTNASVTIKTEERSVSGFHKLGLSGSFTVELAQGTTESLKIEADEDLLSNIISVVKDGELQIAMKGKGWNSKSVKVFLVFKNLDEISSAGSMVMKSTGRLNFDKLEFELNGSAQIDLQLEAKVMEVEISGSGNTKLTGNINKMDVEIAGSGNLDATDLTCQNMDIEISGSGDATVFVAKELNVEISGSGGVAYKGNPNLRKSISGSGSVKKMTN